MSSTEKIFSGASLKYILLLIFLIGFALGIAFLLGQLTFNVLGTNASNAGHTYGIITSAVAFFFFARYLRGKKDIQYVRKFFLLYFLVYFAVVVIIVIPLMANIYYLYSTIGNAMILFSVFTLIIFLLNPEILGISGKFKHIFLGGKHVRVVQVYLFIVLMQVFGFSLLNYAIQLYSGGSAYSLPGSVTGSWFDFVYLSVITLTTIGYGDIHPMIPAAKFSGIVQAILSHIITVLFLAILIVYISTALGSEEES